MLLPLFRLLAALPILTLVIVILTAWLVRRRPGRLRPAWLLGFGTLLVGASGVEPTPWLDPGSAPSANDTIEAGFGGGSYQTCSGARTYGDVGAMYRYETPISDQTSLRVAGGGYGGSDGGVANGGARASVGLEHRWVGASLGLTAGVLHRENALGPVFPTASLRIGPRDKIFLDANFVDGSPAPLPGPGFEVGAGIAFPRLGNEFEPLQIRAGLSLQGFYIAPTVPIGGMVNLDLVGAYGDAHTWGATVRIRLHASR